LASCANLGRGGPAMFVQVAAVEGDGRTALRWCGRSSVFDANDAATTTASSSSSSSAASGRQNAL